MFLGVRKKDQRLHQGLGQNSILAPRSLSFELGCPLGDQAIFAGNRKCASGSLCRDEVRAGVERQLFRLIAIDLVPILQNKISRAAACAGDIVCKQRHKQ